MKTIYLIDSIVEIHSSYARLLKIKFAKVNPHYIQITEDEYFILKLKSNLLNNLKIELCPASWFLVLNPAIDVNDKIFLIEFPFDSISLSAIDILAKELLQLRD